MPRPKNQKSHTELICDIGELSALFAGTSNLDQFLPRIVAMIAEHMHSDVCSIYFYYEDTQELVLEATHGLNAQFIKKVRLKLGEGLTGVALKELRPLCERHASQNTNFRYFPGLGEEKFESFLAVPICRGITMIGAIVIQNTSKNFFSDEDIQAMRAITSQLANTIEMTRLILSIQKKIEPLPSKVDFKDYKFIKGKVGAPGFAFAEVVVISDKKGQLLGGKDISQLKKYSLDNFFEAIDVTEKQLQALQQQIEEKLSDVASLIFTAQILMLKDQSFVDMIVNLIKNGINPPHAIVQVTDLYISKFEQISNPYLREKSFDVRDIGRRLLENLLGEQSDNDDFAQKIVVAKELLPSDALKLSSQQVKGIVLLHGGVTSHLSILARSLQIPLLIADTTDLLLLPEKTKMIIDSDSGNIYVNPSRDVIANFKAREEAAMKFLELKDSIKSQTETEDGVHVKLMANINLLGDLQHARDFKADGIGLYRTEFPFIVRNDFPSEEEQFVIYQKLVSGMPDKEITFRTLDIGGDKVLSYFDHHSEEKNPYMGMRSIRFSLQHTDIFAQQIRAILRASVGAKVRIMFPMISSIDEFREAKKILKQCIKQLKHNKVECNLKPKIGLMIELPAVLEIIDELAAEADFFSIGTNDFIQYMLAVDRTNEKVASLYISHHPAILRALKKIVNAALKEKIDVSICGDMAHKVEFVEYMLGIGIRCLSVDATYIPKLQSAIEKINIKKAQKKVEILLKESRLHNISKLMGLNKV